MLAELIFESEQEGPALDWAQARCRDGAATMLSLFFSEQIDDIARAKDICRVCPLIDPCLDGARARREPWGVWGGQLVVAGVVVPRKRPRGRPRKDAAQTAA